MYNLQYRLSSKELDKENLEEIQKSLREQEGKLRWSLEKIGISPTRIELFKSFEPIVDDVYLHSRRENYKETYPYYPHELKRGADFMIEVTQWPYRENEQAKRFYSKAESGKRIRTGMVVISE